MIAIKLFVPQRCMLFCRAGVLTGLFGVSILFKDWILAGMHEILWVDCFDSKRIY